MPVLPALIDALAPDPCPACGGAGGVAGGTRLCSRCEAVVRPLPVAVCLPPPVAGAWALGPYQGPLGALVRRGKYQPDAWVIDELGRRLAFAARGRLPAVDAVAHVPVPWSRRLRRGFDQAERLARPVAAAVGAPWVPAIWRERAAEQAGRGLTERRLSARGAFRAVRVVPPRVLLVDDVITTGATCSACAWELLAAGARRVYVLAVAWQGARRVSGPADGRRVGGTATFAGDSAFGRGAGLWHDTCSTNPARPPTG